MRMLSIKGVVKKGVVKKGVVLVFCVAFAAGCGVLKEQDPASEDQELARIALEAAKHPLPPEKTKQVLSETGQNWLYGQGLGETALNVGAIVVFPPYALFLAGNAVVSLSGYEPVRFSDALPGEGKKEWTDMYNGVAAGPGRLAAAVAGEEFRTPEEARVRLKKILQSDSPAKPSGSSVTGSAKGQKRAQ